MYRSPVNALCVTHLSFSSLSRLFLVFSFLQALYRFSYCVTFNFGTLVCIFLISICLQYVCAFHCDKMVFFLKQWIVSHRNIMNNYVLCVISGCSYVTVFFTHTHTHTHTHTCFITYYFLIWKVDLFLKLGYQSWCNPSLFLSLIYSLAHTFVRSLSPYSSFSFFLSLVLGFSLFWRHSLCKF